LSKHRRARLHILPGGDYHIMDFSNVGEEYVVDTLPTWAEEKFALLCLMKDGTDMPGVGYRHSADTFYINEGPDAEDIV